MSSTIASATSALASATSKAASGGHLGSAEGRPPVYKAIGVALAVSSGVFIGVSFVLKKKGLLAANLKDGKEAGEGYGYLKNAWWWTGMILMILGEICNFCAYAFVEAILVTPLGALSVVITAILSSIFLGERLSFVGKIGCFMCIVGSIVIVINAPEQSSVSSIQDMKRFIISPGFLSYAGIVILGCVGVVVWIAPKYGNKSMMVYISICSLIGGLSVVATQGLGAAVVKQASGTPQFNQWFLYVLLVFVVVTLLVEIVYLNKALNIFNAALVTPTYYVCFTSSTIVTSAILFRGFKGAPSSIATVVMGFLQICSGVVLLQLSKSAKDVPDAEIFRGDLDQVRTVAEQSEPESEPKADAIRGTAAIIRRISIARQKAEVEEARRIREEKINEMLNGPNQNMEWDGVRRRVTFSAHGTPRRRNTMSGSHPPLGMSRMPDLEEGVESATPATNMDPGRRRSMSVDEAMRTQVYGIQPDEPDQDQHPAGIVERVKSLFIPKQRSSPSLRSEAGIITPHRDLRDASGPLSVRSYTSSEHPPPLPMVDMSTPPRTPHLAVTPPVHEYSTSTRDFAPGQSSPSLRRTSRGSEYTALPPQTSPGTPPPASSTPDLLRPSSGSSGTGRQFSFQSIFARHGHSRSRSNSSTVHVEEPVVHSASHSHTHLPRLGLGSRGNSTPGAIKSEEEMLGLVKGDSGSNVLPSYDSDEDKEKEKAPVSSVRYVESDSEEEREKEREKIRLKEWEARGEPGRS
ncbi:DUF803-domain-containing protein [Choiromyces venosus 120613-1]|uniref:DUF803-domain-containing protein n=1 Tax=Choiromyces venosus 120613-1 TaxID=1336337 RepID=A0A3N4IZL7_9PEZI|nr:DUF803-domain-containing protein [Choiromyces venosus 120613-1]